MTLLYEKNLLAELIRIAQQGNLPAPQAGVAPDIKDIASKMIDHLRSQFTEQVAQNNTFTADRDNADLNMKNLVNMQALMTFIQFNGIRFNNMKLAFPHTKTGAQGIDKAPGDPEFNQLPANQKALYVKYPTPTGNEDDFQFYVYKDGIVKYLEDLVNKTGSNNPQSNMMRPYVTALVNEINKLTDFDVSPTPGGQGGAQNQTGEQGNQQGNQKGNQSGAQNQQGQQAGQGEDAQSQAQAESYATALTSVPWPLAPDDIDLNRIGRWILATKNAGVPGMEEWYDYMYNLLQTIRERYPLMPQLHLGSANFQELADEIYSKTQGKETSAAPYISLIFNILTGTRSALSTVYDYFRNKSGPIAKDYAKHAGAQLSDVYPKNLSVIRTLQGQMEAMMRNVVQTRR